MICKPSHKESSKTQAVRYQCGEGQIWHKVPKITEHSRLNNPVTYFVNHCADTYMHVGITEVIDVSL
jgi:hypothetical protein